MDANIKDNLLMIKPMVAVKLKTQIIIYSQQSKELPKMEETLAQLVMEDCKIDAV